MTAHAVIICGSRNWSEQHVIKRVVESLPKGTVVIHGAADGADKLGGIFAEAAGLTVVSMPAQWDLHSDRAGPLRNVAMLDVLCRLQQCGYKVAVCAFPLPDSRGTRHMMRIAEIAKIKVCCSHGSVSK